MNTEPIFEAAVEVLEEAKFVFGRAKNWLKDAAKKTVVDFINEYEIQEDATAQEVPVYSAEEKSYLEDQLLNLETKINQLTILMDNEKDEFQSKFRNLTYVSPEEMKAYCTQFCNEVTAQCNELKTLFKEDIVQYKEAFVIQARDNKAIAKKNDELYLRLFGLGNTQDKKIAMLDDRLKESKNRNLATQLQMEAIKKECNLQKKQIKELNQRIKELIEMNNKTLPSATQAKDERPRILNIPVTTEIKPSSQNQLNSLHSSSQGFLSQMQMYNDQMSRLYNAYHTPRQYSPANWAFKNALDMNMSPMHSPSKPPVQNQSLPRLSDINNTYGIPQDSNLGNPVTVPFNSQTPLNSPRIPDEVLICPNPRLVFHESKDMESMHITNSFHTRIAFTLNGTCCYTVDLTHGIIFPGETIKVAVTRSVGPSKDYPSLILDWVPIASNAPNVFDQQWFKELKNVRRKIVPIKRV